MIDNPSEQESEYFARQQFERMKKLDEEKQKALAEKEKEELQKLHFMRCPKCGMSLIEIDYKHLKIDRCSHCDGIWLDAGELEEIVNDDEGRFTAFLRLFKDS
mgnify:CR=1 FL=1